MPRSIHGRMLALSVATTLVALPVAGFAIGGVLERFVTHDVDERLSDRLQLLGAVVRSDGTVDRTLLARPEVTAAFERGGVWTIDAPGGAFGSAMLPITIVPPGDSRHGPGPRREHDREREREQERDAGMPFDTELADGTAMHGLMTVRQSSAGPVRLGVAVPRATIERPLRGALLPLLATLAIVALLLAVATLVQLRLGLRPLRTLRDRVAAVRSGAAGDVPEDQPEELRPLAIELNALVREQGAALATARGAAANLAHALKTPVATLALDLAGDPRGGQVARIDATIRHHLSRARGGAVDRRAASVLQPAVEALVGVVAAVHRGRGVTVAAEVPDATVAVDAADLDELVGNLIDNAARHARSSVMVAAERVGGFVELRVTDDGPGIPPADRARATDPGVRLDERGDGHGFGLTIVRDLAALYGGRLTLNEADGGGLVAAVTLPVSAAG